MAGKGRKSAGKSKVKVGKLQVNKETVKDLTKDEAKKVKGGIVVIVNRKRNGDIKSQAKS